MLSLQQIKYCMDNTYEWKQGWLIGKYDGSKDATILDENFQAVPKVVEEDGREFLCYDMKRMVGVHIEI